MIGQEVIIFYILQSLTFTYNIDMIDVESWRIIILSDYNINSSGFSTDESMKYKNYKNEI